MWGYTAWSWVNRCKSFTFGDILTIYVGISIYLIGNHQTGGKCHPNLPGEFSYPLCVFLIHLPREKSLPSCNFSQKHTWIFVNPTSWVFLFSSEDRSVDDIGSMSNLQTNPSRLLVSGWDAYCPRSHCT